MSSSRPTVARAGREQAGSRLGPGSVGVDAGHRARPLSVAARQRSRARAPPRRTRRRGPRSREHVHGRAGRSEQHGVAGLAPGGRAPARRGPLPQCQCRRPPRPGHPARVAQGLAISGAVGADAAPRRAAVGAPRRPGRRTSAPLARPPAIHTTSAYAAQGRRRRMRVGRLGVVDVADAADDRDLGDPVRVGRKARSPSRTATGGDAVGAGERGCGQRVGDDVRRRRRVEVVDACELGRRVCRSATNARSTRTSSTTPSMPTAGTPRVKPMARQPSTTSASRTSSLGDRVGDVVDAGDLGALVDAALVAA